jgi:hypothetical protein
MTRVGRVLLMTAFMATALAAFAAEPLVPPPEGAPLLFEASAEGVQIYNCEPEHGSLAWVFKSPEANLYDKQGRQIGRHYGGPTWRLEDGSAVVGEVAAKADSPAPAAIPWLLLRAKSHDGTGVMSQVAFVRRSETKDGLAPASGCDEQHAGHQARMRYSATYQFYGAVKQ